MKRELPKKQEMEGQKLAAAFLAEIPVPQELIRINDGDRARKFLPGGLRMAWNYFPFDEMMVGGGEGGRRKRNAKVKSSDKTVLAAQLSQRGKTWLFIIPVTAETSSDNLFKFILTFCYSRDI